MVVGSDPMNIDSTTVADGDSRTTSALGWRSSKLRTVAYSTSRTGVYEDVRCGELDDFEHHSAATLSATHRTASAPGRQAARARVGARRGRAAAARARA